MTGWSICSTKHLGNQQRYTYELARKYKIVGLWVCNEKDEVILAAVLLQATLKSVSLKRIRLQNWIGELYWLCEVGGLERQWQLIHEVAGGHVCVSSFLSVAICLCVRSLMSLHSDSSSRNRGRSLHWKRMS